MGSKENPTNLLPSNSFDFFLSPSKSVVYHPDNKVMERWPQLLLFSLHTFSLARRSSNLCYIFARLHFCLGRDTSRDLSSETSSPMDMFKLTLTKFK